MDEIVHTIQKKVDAEKAKNTTLRNLVNLDVFNDYEWPSVARAVLPEAQLQEAKKNYKDYTLRQLYANVQWGMLLFLLDYLHT